jgi:putative tryptophan/tyrosine transport system permease protein
VSLSDLAAVAVFAAIAIALGVVLRWFLHTDLGLALRATGDNEKMIRALGTDTDGLKLLGLANGLVALSAALVSQYQGLMIRLVGYGLVAP